MTDKRTPAPTTSSAKPPQSASGRAEISAFLEAARKVRPAGAGAGRLVFALDATMSRQPTWDMAVTMQGAMFDAARDVGGLAVQLVYYRGLSECRASRWVSDAATLKDLMVRIDCRGGHTQIGRVLRHVSQEHSKAKVSALVFIGDAMEEGVDTLVQTAGEMGLRGIPAFMFQEGNDASVERAFREIAKVSGGAWFRFDRNSADVLSRLLQSIAVYASGGFKALENRGTREDRLLIGHLRGTGA